MYKRHAEQASISLLDYKMIELMPASTGNVPILQHHEYMKLATCQYYSIMNNIYVSFCFFSLLTYKSTDIQVSVYSLKFIAILQAPGDRQVADSSPELVSKPTAIYNVWTNIQLQCTT